MFYNNSPTAKNIKRLKAARATEMRIHIDAMKMVTAKYKPLIKDAEELREAELTYEASLQSDRFTADQRGQIEAKISRKRAFIQRKTDDLTSVE